MGRGRKQTFCMSVAHYTTPTITPYYTTGEIIPIYKINNLSGMISQIITPRWAP